MEDLDIIDEIFYVKQQRWGTWDSFYKDGTPIITSLTQDKCISATRFYLKGRQEGFSESKTYDSKISGKL